ncbi:cytochrome c oxidase assembly factor CtaG [Paenisporosarcina sp. NPDC076898]|uniref:cytochrome c oxidase assembly factor CtaG n=1 Tax=unclassified Paenisporosarcina TaxID=2642018 RepID=UPI003D02B44D
MPLSIFGFQALWSPFFILSTLLVIGLYFFITSKKQHWFEDTQPVTKKEITAFVSAMLLLYAVKGSPVDLMGHILFSVHMAQMALLLMLVPPLLIVGLPSWIWQKIIRMRYIQSTFRFLTKPLLALIVFSGMFSIYHIPLVFDTIKQNELYHTIFTIILFLSAILLWWPIMNKLKGEHQVHGLGKIGYIIGSAILITPACALIIFASHPMYDTYSNGDAWLKAMELCVPSSTLSGLTLSGPELFSNMPIMEDQQLGGIIMKIIQEIIYGVILAIVFFQWYRSEQENADEITQQALLDRQAYAANK